MTGLAARRLKLHLAAGLIAAIVIGAGVVHAEDAPAQQPAAQPAENQPAAAEVAKPPANASIDEIQRYCSNIVDPARDRRYLIQKQELEKLQGDVDQRLKALDKRKAEYQDWLQKRNDFLKMAEQDLVDMYKSMKPADAAPRLAATDINVTAAILLKLTPRQSGLILAQMDPDKAAKLTGLISSAADTRTSQQQP
jgi:flagellar motility protein MotE (MotC chaperone)